TALLGGGLDGPLRCLPQDESGLRRRSRRSNAAGPWAAPTNCRAVSDETLTRQKYGKRESCAHLVPCRDPVDLRPRTAASSGVRGPVGAASTVDFGVGVSQYRGAM